VELSKKEKDRLEKELEKANEAYLTLEELPGELSDAVDCLTEPGVLRDAAKDLRKGGVDAAEFLASAKETARLGKKLLKDVVKRQKELDKQAAKLRKQLS
jgi:hypothetical protein